MIRNNCRRFLSSVSFRNQIAIVKIDNPPVNVINRPILEFLKETFDELQLKDNVDGIILTADRNGVFSAGLDLLEFGNAGEEEGRQYWKMVQDMWLSLYMCPLPGMFRL